MPDSTPQSLYKSAQHWAKCSCAECQSYSSLLLKCCEYLESNKISYMSRAKLIKIVRALK